MRALVNRREGDSLRCTVEEVPTPTVTGEKDLICKIEASPINPSDLGKLGLAARLGGDSVSALEGGGGGVTCKLPADAPLTDDFKYVPRLISLKFSSGRETTHLHARAAASSAGTRPRLSW